MIRHYILDASGDPQPEPDLIKWGIWMAEISEQRAGDDAMGRHVAVSVRGEPGNEVRISTVFLGTDHGYRGQVELFETMVFGPCPYDEHCERYATREDAEIGHYCMVTQIEAWLTLGGEW